MTAVAFHLPERPVSLLAFVRPFLLLAVLAFLAGFGGYLILGPPNVMNLTPSAQTSDEAAVTTPASEIPASTPSATGDWNAPKPI